MTVRGWRYTIKKSGFYFPFTFYFLLFVAAVALAWQMLNNSSFDAYSSFADIFYLLLQVASVFIIAFIALAFLSVLVPLLHFLYNRSKKSIVCTLQTAETQGDLYKKQRVKVLIKPVWKPLCGFIRLRLQYETTAWSQKLSIAANKTGQLFGNTVEGVIEWNLPQIKEYHIHKSIVYFEDFFQFFSFAVDVSTSSRFFIQPLAQQTNLPVVAPRKTEDTSTRINELRKVEGEYLNYKNFENNDDVRRIVWKIYARNKELVVRVPETIDPYASHLYMFASFFTGMAVANSTVAQLPFLNYFKTMVYSIYQQLASQGFNVKYIADQPIAASAMGNQQQATKYAISTSQWQTNNDLVTYCNTRDASVVVLSSLSNAKQVQQLLEKHGSTITFIFVPLTKSLRKQQLLHWVQWLFIQNEKNDMERYKTSWATSPALRLAVVNNENTIQQLIAKYQQPVPC